MAIWIAYLTLAIAALSIHCDGVRVLQVAPGWSASHIMFNYRLAETLTEAGHNVTVLITLMPDNIKDVLKKTPKNVQSMVLPMPPDNTDREEFNAMFQSLAFRELDLDIVMNMVRNFRSSSKLACQAMMTDHTIMERLRSAKIDIVLAHVFAYCPVALAHRLSIPNVAWLAPGNFFADQIFWAAGIPDLPACMPSALSYYTDKMTFMERVFNTIWYMNTRIGFVYDHYTESELSVVSMPPYHTANDPTLWELAQKAQAVILNGEPFLDFPRQLIPGFSYLGSLYKKDFKALTSTWQKLMDDSDRGVILFSFGTIANTSLMPFELKEAFFDAFQNLSDYTIILKLEGKLPEGLLKAKHIKLVDWMPQWDLLNHPKMKLFITHGGYNSMLESVQAAVPMILMPLFADQYGNAARAERLGIGKVLHKTTTDSKSIYKTLRSVLDEDRFYKRVRAVASQVEDKMLPNAFVASRQIERIVKSGRLWPRMKVPQKLGYIQYFCLDVIGLLLAIISITCYLSAKLFMIILRFLLDRKRQKYI